MQDITLVFPAVDLLFISQCVFRLYVLSLFLLTQLSFACVVCTCMLLCCAAVKRRTWYGYGRIRDTLKLRKASDGLQTCILKMLAKDADSRYSMDQALCDPWLLEASKPVRFTATSHSHPSPTPPPPIPSHAPLDAAAENHASKRAVNKSKVKTVMSPRKTRAGTSIAIQASTKQAAKGDPVPLVQHAIKLVKQVPLHTNRPSASLATGADCSYDFLFNHKQSHDCPTTILH